MGAIMEIRTARLLLRPFTLQDAVEVRRLADDKAIAANALAIPFPYEMGMAEEWIAKHPEWRARGEQIIFAVVLKPEMHLLGALGLDDQPAPSKRGIGILDRPRALGPGLCVRSRRGGDAARVRNARPAPGARGLLTRNQASARVLEKAGMAHEGTRRHHVRHWNEFEDVEEYGILRVDYEKLSRPTD